MNEWLEVLATGTPQLVWIGLLLVGFFLVVLEMYIPGFGIAGISGLISLAIAIFFLARGNVVLGLIITVVVVALLCVALSISIRSAARGRLAKSGLVLKAVSTEEHDNDLTYYIGQHGVARTILRPAGVSEIKGVRLNVLTDGEFINEGCEVVVRRVEGNRIFVSKA